MARLMVDVTSKGKFFVAGTKEEPKDRKYHDTWEEANKELKYWKNKQQD